MINNLTIGIATYADPGLWFTLEALQMYHPRVGYLVISNEPKPANRDRSVVEGFGGTFIHNPELDGPAQVKGELFRQAKTDWVMSIDSHVLLEPGAVRALLNYIEAFPESNDLIQGPLIYDDGVTVSTHWKQHQPPALWGQWDTYPCWRQDSLFEIPMQGMGLFAMRRKVWPGFHPLYRGFGGEEGYIHEKVRRQGGRCLCLPALMWRHKFRDQEGDPPAPYPSQIEDHAWNLLVGHREMGIDAVDLIKSYVPCIEPERFDWLVKEAEKVQPFGGIGVLYNAV